MRHLKKYRVRAFIPAVYEVAAEDIELAEREVKEKFKAENSTWIDPEVQVVELA